MREELKENIKVSLQRLVPFIVSLIFILFNHIPSNLGYPNIIRPDIGCICVFYWVLYRPDLFNLFTVFVLGFIGNLVSTIPVGLEIISFLTIYLIVSNKFSIFNNKPFNVVWFGFSVILLFVELLKWFTLSVYHAEFISFGNLFFTILFTIACYPVVSLINESVREYLMNDEG